MSEIKNAGSREEDPRKNNPNFIKGSDGRWIGGYEEDMKYRANAHLVHPDHNGITPLFPNSGMKALSKMAGDILKQVGEKDLIAGMRTVDYGQPLCVPKDFDILDENGHKISVSKKVERILWQKVKPDNYVDQPWNSK